MLLLNQPMSSKRNEKTYVLVCAIFIMKKQPFIPEKRCSFLLADIGILIDSLAVEKKKTKTCSADSCRSTIFKKEQEKQFEKFDYPAHQIKECKKRQECLASTSTTKHILKGVLVTKRKLKSDVGTISDLIRNEKYVDNNIHIFDLL